MEDKVIVDLYRSVRNEDFPHGVLRDLEPAPGLLNPDFYDRPLPSGKTRKADVVIDTLGGVEWVQAGGGTSLFDKPQVFPPPGWMSFQIPEGTPVPATLKIVFTNYSKTFKANHYQIESRTGTIRKDAMIGALDNLARAAIVRSVELGRMGRGGKNG